MMAGLVEFQVTDISQLCESLKRGDVTDLTYSNSIHQAASQFVESGFQSVTYWSTELKCGTEWVFETG